MRKINYITHDSWWDSDLPLFSHIGVFFRIYVFVFSSRLYKKKYPEKESVFVEHIFQFERTKRLTNPLSFFPALEMAKSVRKNYQDGQIIVYVFGDDFYFNFLFLLFAKKKYTIISIHNYTKHSDSPFFENIAKKVYVKFFRNFHFQSQIQYQHFSAEHPKKSAFFTNMPLKDFGVPANQITLRHGHKRNFLFFGNIRSYKRLDLFIKAANQATGDAHFIITGSCDNWREFEDMIEDKTKFTCNISFVENTLIPDYFTQADFLVLPYSDTTQSGPFLIALNYGLPVIASDLELFASIIKPGYNGYLFREGNLDALTSCINEASTISTEHYNILRHNQVNMAEQYRQSTEQAGPVFKEFIEKNCG